MVDVKRMLPELRALVAMLADDLLQRATSVASINEKLQGAFHAIHESGRTSQSFEEWREDYLDQVAVAWVLACVFVRFIEDNGLLDECWLAGEGDRQKLADGSYELFFRSHPHETDREYLKFVFKEVGKIPAAKELFEEGKTALWAVDPSGDAGRKLLNFFKEIDPEAGGLKRSFATKQAKTSPIVEVYEKLAPQAQFLGDLYQDLSEHARKKYALLQTPEFIQQFILDRTLTPALDQFGLKNLRVIDPACGSGHFLLGAFDRLFEEWMKPEHGIDNPVVAAQNALDSIFGTDLNPFAIAITRFRLLVAAIQACKIHRLHQQSYAWRLNLATGDSLLWGSKPSFGEARDAIAHQQKLFDVDPIFAVENPRELNRILGQGYHVVVGNPPYIIVRDRAQNESYRQLYSTCHQKYSLGVPFTQRFWDLAIRKGEKIRADAEAVSPAAGFIGMITANSFMKREFGKKLVEDFFPKHDLTHVLDTSGAYIPGHGTPTVILFGRAQKPVGATVRAVLGIKGEPSTPADPGHGLVWRSIVSQVDIANSADAFTSTADVPRETFAKHPWSIGGGGAADLMESLDEAATTTLSNLTDSIGITSFTLEDDVYILPWQVAKRRNIDGHYLREMVVGDMLRDWRGTRCDPAIFPYDDKFQAIDERTSDPAFRYLWAYRTNLSNSKMFGGKTKVECGIKWYEFGRLTHNKLQTPLSIVFAEVATHNHFVLDRGGKVFKQTAPIIKLPPEATEDDHLALLGLLNSSTACFWLKQVCFPKGGDHVGTEGARVRRTAWDERYAFSSTPVGGVPLPTDRPLAMAKKLDLLARSMSAASPQQLLSDGVPEARRLGDARVECASIRAQMIALQEELDWHCYQLYGLVADDLRYSGADLPELTLGQRAFEIVMARQLAAGELETTWFDRHGSTPITEIPLHWPAAYRELVERRIKLIETNKEIALIEKPEYKRRWNTEPWEAQEQRALKNWLLDRLETPKYRRGTDDHPELTTTAQMADVASADAEFRQVAELYRGRADFDLAALVAELVEAEAVPFLPILRYKPAGLRKREVWERTWDLQRQQDAGQDVGEIPVPPKYATADFLKTDYWRLRGKLDVPKERWVSYPHSSTDSDPTLVVGWAGWNHLQQATALIAYYDARKREGWDAKRLAPLLSGLDQLLPWIHQWHPDVDPEFGETAGQSFQTMLEHDVHELGLTLEDIRNWTPPEKAKKASKGRKKKVEAEADE
jgi:hypothetical protein